VEKRFEQYKGIHPGLVLERELRKRSLKKRPFALSVGEYPQTLNAITKGKRAIPVGLAMKIDRVLGIEPGTMALLQTYYDIKTEQEKAPSLQPDLSLLRSSLFWDTDINKIDWQKQYRAVVQRIFERGNEVEKEEITRFYGKAKIKAALEARKTNEMTLKQISLEDGVVL
jgi:plasmid maintenance system antidote protein VapI